MDELARLEREWRILRERCLATLSSIDADALETLRELARIRAACETLIEETRAWLRDAGTARAAAADVAATLEDATETLRAGEAALEAAAAENDRLASEAGGSASEASALASKYRESDDAAETLIATAAKLKDLSAEETAKVAEWRGELEKGLAERAPAATNDVARSARSAKDAAIAAAATCREPLAASEKTRTDLDRAREALVEALETLATERAHVAETVDRAVAVAEKASDDGALAREARRLLAQVAERVAGLAADALAMADGAAQVITWRKLLDTRRGELELAKKVCAAAAAEAEAAAKRAVALTRDLAEHGDAVATRDAGWEENAKRRDGYRRHV